MRFLSVVPAQSLSSKRFLSGTGTQCLSRHPQSHWTPACAGVTVLSAAIA